MTLIKDLTDCSTLAVRGLDNQLVWLMNQLQPELLVQINDLPVDLSGAVHPYLQEPAWENLKNAIAARAQRMTVNSAYRTLAAQQLLRSHYENGCCGITAAAPPGRSNHNNASAIDIEDADGWQPWLEAHGWKRLGSFDPMHFDYLDQSIKDTRATAVVAFQKLWNQANPADKLLEDGDFGIGTSDRLLHSPSEGFPGVSMPRILCLTSPIQMGRDVGLLQLALRKHGIDVGKADMIFSPSLEMAVEEYQQKHNLHVDGIVGGKVRQALGI